VVHHEQDARLVEKLDSVAAWQSKGGHSSQVDHLNDDCHREKHDLPDEDLVNEDDYHSHDKSPEQKPDRLHQHKLSFPEVKALVKLAVLFVDLLVEKVFKSSRKKAALIQRKEDQDGEAEDR